MPKGLEAKVLEFLYEKLNFIDVEGDFDEAGNHGSIILVLLVKAQRLPLFQTLTKGAHTGSPSTPTFKDLPNHGASSLFDFCVGSLYITHRNLQATLYVQRRPLETSQVSVYIHEDTAQGTFSST